MPAAINASIHLIFCSVGTVVFSIWRPSRGPTSWMMMSDMMNPCSGWWLVAVRRLATA